jgi:hypothetical protein
MSLQWLATVATVVAGVIAVGGVAIALVRFSRPRIVAWLTQRRQGLALELIPIRFELSLGKPVPTVMLALRAVNYLRSPLVLESIRIRFLHVGASLVVDEITSPDEYEIPARQSREVTCRRKLIESEAAALRELSSGERWRQGSVMCSARGAAGKRNVRFEPAGEFSVYGTVDGGGFAPTAA